MPVTQLTPSGFPGQRYGSFASKVAAVVVIATVAVSGTYVTSTAVSGTAVTSTSLDGSAVTSTAVTGSVDGN